MSVTQTFTDTLVVLECGECGATFGMTAAFQRDRQNDHRTFYCVNGHPRHYPGQSAQEKAEAEAERQRQRADRLWRDALARAEERDHARRQAAASRGVVTRMKRRIGKGVCPCCNRTFADLGRHMAGQHPEFADGGQP